MEHHLSIIHEGIYFSCCSESEHQPGKSGKGAKPKAFWTSVLHPNMNTLFYCKIVNYWRCRVREPAQADAAHPGSATGTGVAP